MWADQAVPRLAARGLGREVAVADLRLTGIGESQVAERLGEALLRGDQPDRRDLCPGRGRRRPDLGRRRRRRRAGRALVEGPPRTVLDARRRARLGDRRRRPGARRIGGAPRRARLDARGGRDRDGGSFAALLGDADWLRFDESIAPDAPASHAPWRGGRRPRGRDGRPRSGSPGAPGSSAAARSGSPSGPDREAATRPCRSRSRRPRPSASVDAHRVHRRDRWAGRARHSRRRPSLLESLRPPSARSPDRRLAKPNGGRLSGYPTGAASNAAAPRSGARP